MAPMNEYSARTYREGRWWVAEVQVAGTTQATQARRLADIASHARDLVATILDCEPEEVTVTLDLVLPEEVVADLDRSQRLREEAATAQAQAAEAVRSAAARLAAQGMSQRDIGAALGVSHQRANQLLASR